MSVISSFLCMHSSSHSTSLSFALLIFSSQAPLSLSLLEMWLFSSSHSFRISSARICFSIMVVFCCRLRISVSHFSISSPVLFSSDTIVILYFTSVSSSHSSHCSVASICVIRSLHSIFWRFKSSFFCSACSYWTLNAFLPINGVV